MINKTKATLQNVGIIATIVLISAILLKLSLKDDRIKIAPASASAAGANQSIVNPSSQIAVDFKEDLANSVGTFQDVLSESESDLETKSIANALEPFWTASRTTDDTLVTDALLASDTINSGTSGVSEPIDYGGNGTTGATFGDQSSTGTTALASGVGTVDSSGGDSSGSGTTNKPAASDDGTSKDSTSGGGSIDAVPDDQNIASVIVLSSLERLLQDEVDISGAKEAEIFCAKNEYESFQIIVVNPSDTTISQIDLKAGNWHFADAPGEGAPELTLYREHYVKIDQPSYNLKSKLGMYPDALIPFIDPYTGKEIVSAKYLAKNQDVGPHKNQGYWVDVHVGSNVKAGNYTNEIEVLAGGEVIGCIPVKLTVWDFTLPDKRKRAWKTWFYGFFYIERVYGIASNIANPVYQQLYERHREFVYEHGIYPTLQKHPACDSDTGAVTFNSTYITDLTTFINKYGVGYLNIPPRFVTQPDEAKLIKYLSDYSAFSTAHPEYGQYVYNLDEANAEGEKENSKRIGTIIDTYAPSVKFMIAGGLYGPDPGFDKVIDIRALVASVTDATTIARLRGYDPNMQIWTYGASSLTDAPIIVYRYPAWVDYSLGATGIIEYRTLIGISPGTTEIDPWVEPITLTITSVSPNRKYNGVGMLLYPGNRAGFMGPVASMRLKVFRDSVEDYEYFKLLESLTSRDQVVTQTSSIAKNYVTCDKTPESYIAKRKAIAEMILNRLKNN